MPDVLVRTDPATITDGIDATAWLRGLLSYGVEERLLLPVLLYRQHLQRHERLPFALYSAVASLSLVVVITDIGVRTV